MKDLTEPLYGNQQIFIPPSFPHVLKLYAKAAIRTQPYDLLTWSASYFRALSEGRSPPVKHRLEYPLIKSNGGLSPGYLRMLIKQFSDSSEVDRDVLWKRWTGVCLKENELKQILCLGGLYNEANIILYKFVAIAAGFLCKSLTQTMILLCELFTDEPDGGSSAISSDLFVDLYMFLATIDSSKEQRFVNGCLKGSEMQNYNGFAGNMLKDLKQSTIDTDIISTTNDEENVQVYNSDSFESDHDLPDKPQEVVESSDVSSEKAFHIIEKMSNEIISTDSTMNESSDINTEMILAESGDADESSNGRSSPIVKRTVTLRVFSEDGEKIASSSAMSIPEEESPVAYLQIDKNGKLFIPKKDVSVEDREAIIEQLQKAQDEKVKSMEAVMDSVEDLAEKARTMSRDADNLSNNKKSTDVEEIPNIEQNENINPVVQKIEVDPNAKGVVNPIFKGLFDNVADKMGVVKALQEIQPIVEQEVIIVPAIPGIGPIIDEDMVDEFLRYVRETASDQCDMFMPRDIRHYFCPPLEKI